MNYRASIGLAFPCSLEKLLTGAALTLVISAVMPGVMHSAAYSQELTTLPHTPMTVAKADARKAQPPLQDGTYLYGQAPKAGQIGATYLVFEVTQNNVVGAFYMPHSSFDCFNGTLKNDQMALTVRNSYDNAQHAYGIGLQQTGVTASTTATAPVGLEGFHRISNLSPNDQRLLSTCQLTEARRRPIRSNGGSR